MMYCGWWWKCMWIERRPPVTQWNTGSQEVQHGRTHNTGSWWTTLENNDILLRINHTSCSWGVFLHAKILVQEWNQFLSEYLFFHTIIYTMLLKIQNIYYQTHSAESRFPCTMKFLLKSLKKTNSSRKKFM